MKKRFLLIAVTALLLTLCFAMPVAAGGGDDVYWGDTAVTDGYYTISESGVLNPGSSSSYNFHYDEDKNVITFSDMGIVYLKKSIGLDIMKDMIIEVVGFNCIDLEGEFGSTYLCGIRCDGDLDFVGGEGNELFVEVDPDSPENIHTCIGVRATGDITINADVLPYAGEAMHSFYSTESYGFYCDGGNFVLEEGYVQPIADVADTSIAIYATSDGEYGGNITVNGGIINGDSRGSGYMITAEDTFLLSDGILNLCGYDGAVYAKNDVRFVDGDATIVSEVGDYAVYTANGKIYVDGGALDISAKKQALYCANAKPVLAKGLHFFTGKSEKDLKAATAYKGEPYFFVTPFKDLKASWYIPSVAWAVSRGITYGTSPDTFSPDKPCTRAEIVCFLYRLEGSPEMSGKCPFKDVQKGIWYEDAVKWAVEEGITAGTDAAQTLFSPNRTCTRAEAACFIYRACGSPEVGNVSNPFVDIGNGGEYYSDAVMFLYKYNITAGTDATHFSPNKTCTRAEIVCFLNRFYKNVN